MSQNLVSLVFDDPRLAAIGGALAKLETELAGDLGAGGDRPMGCPIFLTHRYESSLFLFRSRLAPLLQAAAFLR